MGRLTEECSYCSFADCDGGADCRMLSACYEKKLYDKLREYEDLEEQGLLLKLPCKVGDVFWELNAVCDTPYIYPRTTQTVSHCVYVHERLGKLCFLTKEEAEKALAELKGE